MPQAMNIARRIIVIGSMNIDHMYRCDSLPRNGYCIVASEYEKEIGGKGLNQGFALHQAGCKLFDFYGFVGHDGGWIVDYLRDIGFPVSGIGVRTDMVTISKSTLLNILVLVDRQCGNFPKGDGRRRECIYAICWC